MSESSFQQLVENGALLLTLVFLFDVAASRWRTGQSRPQQIFLGLIIGAIAIGVMLIPWQFAPGIFFDTRSVLLSISGLFFGGVPTLIAMAVAATFRLWQGGAGAWTGVSVILATGTLGLAWRRFGRRALAERSTREFYVFGVTTHLIMLALMFTLPWATALRVLAAISLPVLAVYPLTTALLGTLMIIRLRRIQTQAELERLLTDQKQAQEALHESNRRIRRHAEELTVISDAARRLQYLRSPETLAEELIALLEDTLHYEFSAVLLIDEAAGELVPFAISNQGQGPAFVQEDKATIAAHHITVGQGITGYVAQTGQTIRLGDVRGDPRYLAMRNDLRSELCVPLRAGDRIIGVLNIESRQPDAYTESDQRVLETIASQMALAIEQAQLHAQIQRYASELEQRVRDRTAQLQAANKELEAFAYAVSHDLRAPLRVLDGFSAALLAGYTDKLDEQGRHYLDRIQVAAQRMGQLINDLLNLSRITRAEFTRQPVDLAALAREIAAELRQRDPGRQAEFVVADRLEANGDARLLRSALQNLMENAWKFTGSQPQARIEVGQIAEAGMQPSNLVALQQPEVANPQSSVFFVRDNGVGFDMAYADRLFAPFQRLHSAQTFPGTGIGLVTVQRIITRHGGHVWAEAEVDQGATFYFAI